MKIAPRIDSISNEFQRLNPTNRSQAQEELKKTQVDGQQNGIQGVVRNKNEMHPSKFRTVISDTALAASLSSDEKSFIKQVFREEQAETDVGYTRNSNSTSQMKLGRNIDVRA